MDTKNCKSFVWQHFSKLDNRAKCNYCTKDYSTTTRLYSLKLHLINIHDIHNNKDYLKWKIDTKGLIWQYFSKQEKYSARCNFAHCKELIQDAYYIPNLTTHLEKYHEHIVKTQREKIQLTWLSPHLKFKGCYAYCKISSCVNYKFNIFSGENYLKYHLVRHNIRQVRTNDNDNNADVMIQQSVNETNNAGPSSHHDITPRQSLGNQESQQGIHEDNLRWINDTEVIWQYFSKHGYKAYCNVAYCEASLDTYDKFTLMHHLNCYHPEIIRRREREVTDTWLSRYFELKNFMIDCNVCRFNVNILCGIEVLISHLECHNINKNSIYKKETGDNHNAYGIAGQSVEENNAGTSSQHDNAPKQPLGNQDDHQGRLQGSESTNKIWKPYML